MNKLLQIFFSQGTLQIRSGRASTQSNLVITPGTPTTYAIAGWTFSAGAPNYTFNLNNNATLGFWGTGITNRRETR